jgi:outer membrane lipoprotein-sorting protein
MTFSTPFVRALAPAAALALLAAPALAASTGELALVEAHLTASQSMTASFIQTDSKNRQLAGTVQLKRPGRIRFEYGRGANMLLVGNGKTQTFIDDDHGPKSTWAMAMSP